MTRAFVAADNALTWNEFVEYVTSQPHCFMGAAIGAAAFAGAVLSGASGGGEPPEVSGIPITPTANRDQQSSAYDPAEVIGRR